MGEVDDGRQNLGQIDACVDPRQALPSTVRKIAVQSRVASPHCHSIRMLHLVRFKGNGPYMSLSLFFYCKFNHSPSKKYRGNVDKSRIISVLPTFADKIPKYN